jgi:hypothetical protein
MVGQYNKTILFVSWPHSGPIDWREELLPISSALREPSSLKSRIQFASSARSSRGQVGTRIAIESFVSEAQIELSCAARGVVSQATRHASTCGAVAQRFWKKPCS